MSISVAAEITLWTFASMYSALFGGASQARFGIQALSPIRRSCYANRAQIANIFSGKLSVNVYSGVGIRYPVYTNPPADPNIIPGSISADPKIICAQ